MKKFITAALSIIIALISVFAVSGCVKNKTFTVTFDKGDQAGAYLYWGETTQTVSSAKDIVAPVFVCPGYNFVGWDSSISDIKGDKTVKALWRQYAFTVTFEGEGGSLENGDGIVERTFNSGLDIVPPQFVRAGYTLSWDTDFATITSSCTVLAKWTPNVYTLSFKDSDGAVLPNAQASIDVNFDTPITLPNDPVKSGYKFACWVDENGRYIDNGMGWRVDGNATAYAQWVSSSDYVIKYDLQGGFQRDNAHFYNDSTVAVVIHDPIRAGYQFTGWTLNGGSDKVLSQDIKKSDLGGDATLIANWSPVQYTIDYDALTVNKKITYGEVVGELPVPQKEGYVFVGWKYKDRIIRETTLWNIAENVTLTAIFKRVYTVAYSLTSIVRKQEVDCSVTKNGDVTSFNKYYIEVVEGETLAENGITIFPVVDPIEQPGWDEYSFGGYWKYLDTAGKAHKISADTIFNVNNLGSVSSDGKILLIPHCRAHWTPSY